jgi:KaiC/GvpD/RAD55 family RecA-like ATPase
LGAPENLNASTGVPDVDLLVGGGVPRGTVIIVEETGSERSNYPSYFLCMKFLRDGLLKGERGIILLTEHSALEYLKASKISSFDLTSYKSSGQLTIIDAFSGYAGLISQPLESKADIVIESPTNTTKMFDVMRNQLTMLDERGYRDKIRLVIDTVSTLVNAAGFQKTWNLWLELSPIHRTTGCITMGIYFPGMHSSEETESFERLTDGVIEFQGRETGEEKGLYDIVRVKKMRRNTFLRDSVRYARSGWEIGFYPKNKRSRED